MTLTSPVPCGKLIWSRWCFSGALCGCGFLASSGDSDVEGELEGLRRRSFLGCLLGCPCPPAGPSPSQSLENSLPNVFHSGSRSGVGCNAGGGCGSRRVLLFVGLCCCCVAFLAMVTHSWTCFLQSSCLLYSLHRRCMYLVALSNAFPCCTGMVAAMVR